VTASLEGRLAALTDLLRARRPLWETRPFAEGRPAWARDHPDIETFVRGLRDEDVDRLEEHADLGAVPGVPAVMVAWSEAVARLTQVPDARAERIPAGLARASARLGEPRLRARVPGRKWRQLEAFVHATLAAPWPEGAARVVDWCAGKGHLGRTLGACVARPVTLVERDAGARHDAETLARKAGVLLDFVELDVHAPSAASVLGPDVAVVALHACGGLLNALLEGATRAGAGALAAAPCCYHRAHPDRDSARGRAALSGAGRRAGLELSHSALRLATADEVVAPGRLRRARRRENAWRLGLDLLLREASGEDRYTPLGRLPREHLALPFGAFCEQVAAARGRALPARWSPEAAERAGRQRALEARAWGLVRCLFRRALELWLVLDRACYLEERGFDVTVTTFCDRGVTPRNLLIRAAPHHGSRRS